MDQLPEPPPDPTIPARTRAAKAIRDLGHELVGHQASVETLDDITDALEALSARLRDGERRSRPAGTFPMWRRPTGDGDALTTFEERPFSGVASPWGCDLSVHREGDEAVARFTLRSAHEGAPGRSHGGIVAAIFDDVMGFVIQIIEEPAFTGELYVRYEAGVPVGRELVMRARLDRREGRKLFIESDLWDGDTRVARSTSTYITVSTFAAEPPNS